MIHWSYDFGHIMAVVNKTAHLMTRKEKRDGKGLGSHSPLQEHASKDLKTPYKAQPPTGPQCLAVGPPGTMPLTHEPLGDIQHPDLSQVTQLAGT
jgi:hypothetical protein